MNSKEEQYWRDEANWRWGMVYRCASDKRIVVPKRHGWGWTLNFGQRSAYLVMAATLLAILVPVGSAVREGRAEDIPLAVLMSVIAVIVVFSCAARIGRD